VLSVILFVWLAGALGVSFWAQSLDVAVSPRAVFWVVFWPAFAVVATLWLLAALVARSKGSGE
jgi:hypothetical protein